MKAGRPSRRRVFRYSGRRILLRTTSSVRPRRESETSFRSLRFPGSSKRTVISPGIRLLRMVGNFGRRAFGGCYEMFLPMKHVFVKASVSHKGVKENPPRAAGDFRVGDYSQATMSKRYVVASFSKRTLSAKKPRTLPSTRRVSSLDAL